MNKKRRMLLGTGAGLLAGCATSGSTVWANQRPPRIGIVTFRGSTQVESGFTSFVQQTGIQADFDYYDIARDLGRLPGIVSEIRQSNTQLVLTWGTSVTEGMTGTYTQTNGLRELPCPLVFALVTAPVVSGIVTGLNRCERPITGVYHVASIEQQMQAIDSYKPFKKIGMLYTPTENNSVVTKTLLAEQLAGRGKALIAMPITLNSEGQPDATHLPTLVGELKQRGAQWLYLPPDSFLGTQAKQKIIPSAHALGIPTFASTEQLMDAGALLGLVCSYFEVGQFAGFKAVQILRNNQFAGDIPVETLKKYSLRINSTVARTLKLTPPLELFGVASFQR